VRKHEKMLQKCTTLVFKSDIVVNDILSMSAYMYTFVAYKKFLTVLDDNHYSRVVNETFSFETDTRQRRLKVCSR